MKASPPNQRVGSPLQVEMVEVDGRIVWVDEVGKMLEVGGKVIDIDEVGDEVPQEVPQVGATGVLGGTGFEAGRVDAQEEGKFVKRLVDPRLLTEEEVAHHELTRLPYRNWCPVSVKAKGKDLDNRGAVDKERKLSEYCFDYCFPGDEFGYNLTVLVGIERCSPYERIIRQVCC